MHNSHNSAKILLLINLFSIFSLKGETDPYFAAHGHLLPADSWVFSPDKAKEVRDKLIDLETATKTNESYKTSLGLEKDMQAIQEKKILLLSTQNDVLAKNLMAERTVSSWEKFGYFALGIAATVLGGWAIGQASK